MLSRLTIRARITIGSVLIAAVIFAIAVIAMRAELASILTDANATLAGNDLTSYATEILANPSGSVDNPGAGILIMVRDANGTAQVDTLPHEIQDALEHRQASNEQFTTTVDDTTFVVVGLVVATPIGDWSLWAARSQAASDLALRGLDTALIVGAFVLLALFGLASWSLAAAALRPVERMRRTAEVLSTGTGSGNDGGVLPVGEARDEISELARTLNAFLDRVRRATEREKQMVSDAAHELRTPLAALKTQLELAHDDFGDSDALAAQVVGAEASVDRLSSLATNLLELSRLESDHGPSGPSSADHLVTELMGCIDRGRMLGLATGTEVAFALDISDGDARFALSTDSFGRMVDNLISNAIAAVKTGGTVTASLQQGAAGLTLEVVDDGPGMPESFIPHAFDRFSRPDDSRTSSTGGSGLGLSLVLAIARAAGGTVALRNGDHGLIATVTVPKM